MKKYIVVSPTFGAFRAGEPVAYRIAEKLIMKHGENIVVNGEFEGHTYTFCIVANEIHIIFKGSFNDETFKFTYETVDAPRRMVDIRGDKEHNEAVKVFKGNITN